MARQRNFHKAQTDRLAEILRKLPPPDIPTRHTPKVADPPNPQKDTSTEERGRPRTREGNGSDKSTSREDGKQRTKEKGKGREEDTPMADDITHTFGERRNDTSSACPSQIGATTSPKTSVPAYIHRKPGSQTGHSRSGSRTRAVSVVSALRKTRSNTKSPAPKPKEDLAKAKGERRKDKERKRTKPIKIATETKSRKEEEEEYLEVDEYLARMIGRRRNDEPRL